MSEQAPKFGFKKTDPMFDPLQHTTDDVVVAVKAFYEATKDKWKWAGYQEERFQSAIMHAMATKDVNVFVSQTVLDQMINGVIEP